MSALGRSTDAKGERFVARSVTPGRRTAELGPAIVGGAAAAPTDWRRRQIDNWLNLAIVIGAPFFWWASSLSLWPGVALQFGVAAYQRIELVIERGLGEVAGELGQKAGFTVALLGRGLFLGGAGQLFADGGKLEATLVQDFRREAFFLA